MRPSELKSLLVSLFNARIMRPVHIEGPPGLGKTQITAQVAKELGIEFKVVHAPLMQPEDYGFPVISADRTNVDFVVSKEKFPLESSACADRGILLIDELAQADNSAQKILRNLIQEREIHGKRLKPGWVIVTTGNRATDRAGANRLLTHMSNVLTRVTLEVSLDDWTNWALANGVQTEVISFIRFKPDLLNQFDPHQEINATPRAWVEGVSKSLGVIDPMIEFAKFTGDVSEGAAAEFCAFLKIYRKLPSPDAILINPTGIDVPTDSSTLYALTGALAHKATDTNFGRIMQYVGRMPAEFGVLFVRDAIKRNPKIQESADFIKWASNEGAKLLS